MWKFSRVNWVCLESEDDEFIFDHLRAPNDEDGAILAEALNVHEQTGLTPKQILEKLKTLEDDGK